MWVEGGMGCEVCAGCRVQDAGCRPNVSVQGFGFRVAGLRVGGWRCLVCGSGRGGLCGVR